MDEKPTPTHTYRTPPVIRRRGVLFFALAGPQIGMIVMGVAFLVFPEHPGAMGILGFAYCFWSAGLTVLLLRFLLRIHGRLEASDHRLCCRCGYSLEALRDTGQCPECGSDYRIRDVQADWRQFAEQGGLAFVASLARRLRR